MHRAKVYGAGSVGNHLSHAARRLGWDVTLCDVSDAALRRTKEDIYPQRYGNWDEGIELFTSEDAPRGDFDVIIIGTPPDTHIPLALDALAEQPRAVLIEKPLCGPGLEQAQALLEAGRKSQARIFAGYNHLVGDAMVTVERLLAGGAIGEVTTLEVEFREHWGGIFAAHPWLSGPADSYLGDWRRGGGASGEHSHAVNLWQHLAHLSGAERIAEVSSMLTYVEDGATYDETCLLHLRTETGLVGRVAQDVVALPPRKVARLQGREGEIQWIAGYDAEGDAVRIRRQGSSPELIKIKKERPDDFIRELEHISAQLASDEGRSPLSLERGLDTMMVVAAAHVSQQEGTLVGIDYERGYVPDAITAGTREPTVLRA